MSPDPRHGEESVEVLREREFAGGLAFLVRCIREGDPGPRTIEVRLNWADYNLWSPDGGAPPERIAEAVALEALARYAHGEVPDPLDAARLRRHWPDADAAVADRLRPRFGTFG